MCEETEPEPPETAALEAGEPAEVMVEAGERFIPLAHSRPRRGE